MDMTNAAPADSLLAGTGLGEQHALMSAHRTEAQRVYDAARAGGLSPAEALSKASRSIRAGQRAQIKHRAELEAAAFV